MSFIDNIVKIFDKKPKAFLVDEDLIVCENDVKTLTGA